MGCAITVMTPVATVIPVHQTSPMNVVTAKFMVTLLAHRGEVVVVRESGRMSTLYARGRLPREDEYAECCNFDTAGRLRVTFVCDGSEEPVYIASTLSGWNGPHSMKQGPPLRWSIIFDPRAKSSRVFFPPTSELMWKQVAQLAAGSATKNSFKNIPARRAKSMTF